MAQFILRNPQIVVNGVNLSDHATDVTVDAKYTAVDTTNFSGLGKMAMGGLRDDSITVGFQQDFASAEVNQTLQPLFFNQTTFTVQINPTTGGNSVTNPAFTASCILLEYTPLSGKAGDLSTAKIKFNVQGNISYATS